jgi:hypothetical protein
MRVCPGHRGYRSPLFWWTPCDGTSPIRVEKTVVAATPAKRSPVVVPHECVLTTHRASASSRRGLPYAAHRHSEGEIETTSEGREINHIADAHEGIGEDVAVPQALLTIELTLLGAAVTAHTRSNMSDHDTSPASILLVNDNVELNEALCALLETNGYEVGVAYDGYEALDCLAAGFRPQLIILDLMMPLMDGFLFRREQKARPEVADIPVVESWTPRRSFSSRQI